MSRSRAKSVIRLRGVRHNNLKNFDLDLPAGKLIVVTGLSGSGKSSLAFDTLYAEGQRRYIETFSPYARQFFDRMDKPQVDSIQGIPPAIALEQRNSVKSTRSTVGTMTELCDYMKLLWPHFAQLHCRQCGQVVQAEPPQKVWQTLLARPANPSGDTPEALVTFSLPLSDKLSLGESLDLIAKQGYQRILIPQKNPNDGLPFTVLRIEDSATALAESKLAAVTVVQDRLKLTSASRARFVEACEQAYHFGKGKLTIYLLENSTPPRHFSNRLHCATCDLDYREPSPALFSFNHPIGACPACRGFGRTITIDYNLAIPDRSLTLAKGAVKPWQTGQSAECQGDLMKYCRLHKVPTDVPFKNLSVEHQNWVIQGDPDYGKDAQHEWPHAWYGVKGYFRSLEARTYKMHVRVLLSRYRSYQTCPQCQGNRFQPETLLYRIASPSGPKMSLADFYRVSVRDAIQFVDTLAQNRAAVPSDPLKLALAEVQTRLRYLDQVGLGYLTLDRPTRSLSGGETERVNLTTCLGTKLVNTLFVLDEPSVGLHPRDTHRLIGILQHLREAGNTVVVVEHESSVMRAADHIVDLGPGHGESGGEVVFEGPYSEILKSPHSLTGQYLSGKKVIPLPERRTVTPETPRLTLSGANLHNLKNLTVEIPLQRLVCVTGVSGSGKSTLVREVLWPLLNAHKSLALDAERDDDSHAEEDDTVISVDGINSALEGWEQLGGAVFVDQSSLGKTPRSNPALYIGAFEPIRELFAQTELARQRGLNASAFSFNSAQGQCERCRGAGFEKIEMQFLSDVFIRCPDCNGRRYRSHILEIKVDRNGSGPEAAKPAGAGKARRSAQTRTKPTASQWSIADMLDATVDEAVQFLSDLASSRPAQKTVQSLKLLQEVGLGYLKLGQPINTLSGGESQRLKLVRYLADFTHSSARRPKPTLFLFDEPTTGLHFDDVRVLLGVFQRLVDAGHTVLIIEHNLDVIKSGDWIVDLGPEAGQEGGEMVVAGTPETVAECDASHTGRALRDYGVGSAKRRDRKPN